jgi:hypothetical protein
MTFAVAAAVLVGLVGTPPSRPAASARPVAAVAETGCDRKAVRWAWQHGGPQLAAGAQAALVGGDADVCAFLATAWQPAERADESAAVDQMIASGGSAIAAAGQRAKVSTDENAIITFLQSGWQQPAVTDRRVRVNQMMAAGGAQVKAAAQKALDAETPEALQTFIDTGWRRPWALDLRLRVNQFMATGGPEVRAAAQRALDDGSTDALTHFIDIDWPVASARDQEVATITDFVNAAQVAGEEAARETAAAEEAGARAAAAAAAARQSAQAAAEAGARAQTDAAVAAAAAKQAATAAANAANAAKQALSAAAAATRAARAASDAASRAAWAAAKAGKAASDAYQAAADAAVNANAADSARAAAQNAREQAKAASKAADAAKIAEDAVKAVKNAANAAVAASNDAKAAAAAATAAAGYLQQAGGDASQAVAAANTARVNANRAARAANAAVAFAIQAAAAAHIARTAAMRAAENANAAAVAADDAAAHAGDAARAAKEATDHANAATVAAQNAVDAATQANNVYEAARSAEAESLATAFEESDETAQGIGNLVRQQHSVDWNTDQASRRTPETNRLIAEAADPATPPAQAEADARKVALALADSSGPWTHALAVEALGGTDDEVLEFARTRIAFAACQDDRTTLAEVMHDGTDALKSAATAALAGSDADVATLLRTGNYPGRELDDRLAVNQVLSAAHADGNTVIAQRAQQALDAGGDPALRAFLEEGQYTARAADERVKANQILADPASGPRLEDTAQIALDGPPEVLHKFLAAGRYLAAQQDQEAAAHDATVTALLAQAAQIATAAMQDAARAQAVAATARNDAAAAAGYAQQAQNAATQAAAYATQARRSADQAETSADQAAASARTARTAAATANAAADRAAHSAMWAQVSVQKAYDSAVQAYDSYTRARDSALAAGKSLAEAVDAAKEVIEKAAGLAQDEQSKAIGELIARCNAWADLYGWDSGPATRCRADANALAKDPWTESARREVACRDLYPAGSTLFADCMHSVFSEDFYNSQLTGFAGNVFIGLLSEYAAIVGTMDAAIVTIMCVVAEPCSVVLGVAGRALAAASPEFAALADMEALLALYRVEATGMAGLGLLGEAEALGKTLSAVSEVANATKLEQTLLETEAEEASLARVMDAIAGCATGNSFAADTLVLLADGSSRRIADVRTGDRVLATDPVTGATGPEPVLGTITGSGDKRLVDLTVAGGVLTATANHLFWVPDLADWVPAAGLAAGQWLRTGSGTRVQITAVRIRLATATVHNLSVAARHTYYVRVGSAAVLVHNESSCPVGIPVDYEATGLPRLAFLRRFDPKLPPVPGGANVAAAELEDGTILIGVSNSHTGMHAEEDILSQLKAGQKIKALYSERSPCGVTQNNCSAQLLANNPNIKIYYAIPYSDNADPEIAKIANAAAKTLLKFLIDKLARKLGYRLYGY